MSTQKNISYIIILFASQLVLAAPFTDYGDGTVLDRATGLTWQKCGSGLANNSNCSGSPTVYYTFASALNYCNTELNLSAKIWRLPNVNELRSILDLTNHNSSIDLTVFPSTTSNLGIGYFTSTTFASTYLSEQGWMVSFSGGGGPYYADRMLIGYFAGQVRCVSGP